jgi:uncharacterized protein YjbI with pentapeptide repeats
MADLRDVSLRDADLTGADLWGANLGGADLRNAKLRKARMDAANLSAVKADGADLREVFLIYGCLDDANLKGCDLTNARLMYADLRRADLRESHLTIAYLDHSDLRWADLRAAELGGACLKEADLSYANLAGAALYEADLTEANLQCADLTGTDMVQAKLIRTDLRDADLSGSKVFGVSTWGVHLEGTKQNDLRISDVREPEITVDNLDLAQFVHLLTNNEKVRGIIDTITSKVVLILGRFTPVRKCILDAIREQIRQHNYTPVLFDFDRPANRDITETVSTLAHMARFIIADITDASSIPQELMKIVPNLPSVPVQPLILAGHNEYGMFEHFRRFPWVLNVYEYENGDALIAELADKVIAPAVLMAEKRMPP